MEEGEASNTGFGFTNKLTGIVVVAFVEPVGVMATLPLHVPAVVRIAELIETLTVVGVVPFVDVACDGWTIIQFPQLVVVPVARKLTELPGGLVTLMVWAGGEAVPIW